MYTNQTLNHIYNNYETSSKLTLELLSYYMHKYKRLERTTLTKYPKKKIINSLNNLFIYISDFDVDEDIVNLRDEIDHIITKMYDDDYYSLFYNDILSITLFGNNYTYLKQFLINSLFTVQKDIINDKEIYSIEISIDKPSNTKLYDLCDFNVDIINEFHKFNMNTYKSYNNKYNKTENELVCSLYSIFDTIRNTKIEYLSDANNLFSGLFNITMTYINSMKSDDDINNINKYFSLFILFYNKIIIEFPNNLHDLYRFYLNYIARINEIIEKSNKDTDRYIALLNFKNLLIKSSDKLN